MDEKHPRNDAAEADERKATASRGADHHVEPTTTHPQRRTQHPALTRRESQERWPIG